PPTLRSTAHHHLNPPCSFASTPAEALLCSPPHRDRLILSYPILSAIPNCTATSTNASLVNCAETRSHRHVPQARSQLPCHWADWRMIIRLVLRLPMAI